MDDASAVLVAPLRAQAVERRTHSPPVRDLRFAAARVLIERDVERLNELRASALDEPRHVLGEVLGRLGAEVAEVPQNLVAHAVPVGDVALRPELRIQVPAAVAELEVEGKVVEPRAHVLELVRAHAEIGGEVARRALHRMAEADRANRAAARDRPAEDRHRVHVLQQKGLGAELLHVAAELEQHRDRAQPAHDAADPDRVPDRLA